MLSNQHFYHALIRKYVAYFGSLFNDIIIERNDGNNTTIQTITVPISYGPKQKFIARLEQDPEGKRPLAITLPRMSFEITNMTYDTTRKLNMLNKITKTNPNNSNEYNYSYTPVPINFTFVLSIYTKNVEDGLQILEQIIPYFPPDFSNTLSLVPELDLAIDIPVNIQEIKMNDRYEGTFENPRYIIYSIVFQLKGFLYGPVRNTNIIKKAIVNVYDESSPRKNFMDFYVTANNEPAFNIGELIFQKDGKYITGRGVVENSNSSFVQLVNFTGSFYPNTMLISSNSNNIANVISLQSNTSPRYIIVTQPGLLANGQPTNDSTLSINQQLIKASDNYGISIDIEEIEWEKMIK